MQPINVHYFYNLAKSLQELNKIQSGNTLIERFGELYFAENALRDFLGNDLLPPQACRERGETLATVINTILQSLNADPPRTDPLSAYEVTSIQNSLRDFETVMESEYRVKPIFAVSKKGLYSIEQLVFRGYDMVPDDVHSLMPDMREDLKDAGRCIAFEVPTAAAFHLFRATEAGVKAYIVSIRNTPVTDAEKRLGLGGYKKILEALGVDARVLAALDQLIKLHRNPTIHPDVRVSNEEVLATLGMIDSFIRIVAIDMQRRAKTPNKSLDEFLPTIEEIEADAGRAPEPITIEGTR